MPRLNDSGFGQIFIIIVLILGLLAGLFLVRQKQIFTPDAAPSQPNIVRDALINQSSTPDEEGNRVILKSERFGVYGNPSFQVKYDTSSEKFIIEINDTPIEKVRAEVERDLLNKAGKNIAVLCNLDFTIIASHLVKDDGYNATDNKLAICKLYQMNLNELSNRDASFIERIKELILSILGQRTFLSDQKITTTTDLPLGSYISLCRNDGSDAEGVWQIIDNPRVAEFLYNQQSPRCGSPVPNYLVFTESVEVGTYLSLCLPDGESSPKEWVWQINGSGRVADYLYTQDTCTPPVPKPEPLKQVFAKLLSVNSHIISSCPAPFGQIKTPSYQGNSATGHCSSSYGSCPANSRRAKSIDVTTSGQNIIFPTINGQEVQWSYLGQFSLGVNDCENGVPYCGIGAFFQAVTGSDRWILHLLHLDPKSITLSGGKTYFSGQTAGKVVPGVYLHINLGKNIKAPSNPPLGAEDFDPGWVDPTFMCIQ